MINSFMLSFALSRILIRGSSLSRLLNNQKPQSELLQIFLKVCDAVDYAHSRGILHLDIKPSNIEVSDYGEVLLIDWGLSQIQLSRIDDLLNEASVSASPDHK